MKPTWIDTAKHQGRSEFRYRGVFLMTVGTCVGLCLTVLLSLLIGCAKRPIGKDSGHFQLPWPSDDGTYQLQYVHIPTFSNPEGLEGAFAEIIIDPKQKGGGLVGATPSGRYLRTKDGHRVPMDFASLQAAVVYAHIERLHDLDKKLSETTFGIQWPLTVGIAVQIQGGSGRLENNALFDSRWSALLLSPYTQEQLPVALNAGILAHEHFHLIFQHLVLDDSNGLAVIPSCAAHMHGLSPRVDANVIAKFDRTGRGGKARMLGAGLDAKQFNVWLLRALNEGLADFWGWIYTGDANFLKHSLPKFADRRRLDKPAESLPNLGTLKAHMLTIEDERELLEYAYRVGSTYGRFFRQLSLDISGKIEPTREERLVVARALVTSLTMISPVVAYEMETDYLAPDLLLKPFILNLPSLNEAACETLKKTAAFGDQSGKPVACEGEQP